MKNKQERAKMDKQHKIIIAVIVALFLLLFFFGYYLDDSKTWRSWGEPVNPAIEAQTETPEDIFKDKSAIEIYDEFLKPMPILDRLPKRLTKLPPPLADWQNINLAGFKCSLPLSTMTQIFSTNSMILFRQQSTNGISVILTLQSDQSIFEEPCNIQLATRKDMSSAKTEEERKKVVSTLLLKGIIAPMEYSFTIVETPSVKATVSRMNPKEDMVTSLQIYDKNGSHVASILVRDLEQEDLPLRILSSIELPSTPINRDALQKDMKALVDGAN